MVEKHGMSTTVLDLENKSSTLNLSGGGGGGGGGSVGGAISGSIGASSGSTSSVMAGMVGAGVCVQGISSGQDATNYNINMDTSRLGSDVATTTATTTTTTTQIAPDKTHDYNGSSSTIGPITTREQKSRPTPYSRPILLGHDSKRKKKRLSWRPDKHLEKFHYFELIADERVNVHKLNSQLSDDQTNASSTQPNSPSSPLTRMNPLRGGIAHANIDGSQRRPGSRSDPLGPAEIQYAEWRLILIDFTPELPSPGWNSVERTAQAERETYVLGAIDLPGQPSTLDEPDSVSNGGVGASSGATSRDEAKIIPLDNPEGMYTEYPATPPHQTMLAYY